MKTSEEFIKCRLELFLMGLAAENFIIRCIVFLNLSNCTQCTITVVYFCAWNTMNFARLCAIFFAQIAQNRKYFFANFCAWNEKSFTQFVQNRKYYAKRNFLSKLTKFEILCTELNNWRFIQLLHTKKLLTKKYA